MQSALRGILIGGVATAIAIRLASYSRRIGLRGKVAIVTGGSRGLGFVLARTLLGHGARVAICGRDERKLEDAVSALAAGTELYAASCDVAGRDATRRFVEDTESRLGPVDILVNNAGIISCGPVGSMEREDFARAMAVHFFGPLNMIDAVLPGMLDRQSGRIVNIASIGGKLAVPHLVPYCASKFALVGLSDGLRAELLEKGVVVTTVCPGLMRTGSHRNALFKGNHEAEQTLFSLMDANPILSISVEAAARKIVRALVEGRPHVVLGAPAVIADRFRGLAPGLLSDIMALTNRMLPSDENVETRYGYESETRLSPSILTAFADRASERTNEIR